MATGPGRQVDAINAMPTKAFFVDMLVKDIALERAILDLVDNCIDGAKRLRDASGESYEGLFVRIRLAADCFEIVDNCGGFDITTAKEYAFRFGRLKQARSTSYSIGQFGVGMKRALFKFGREFRIESTTASEHWVVEVDVDQWETDDTNWHFDFSVAETGLNTGASDWGTSIRVVRLRPEVSLRFASDGFRSKLAEMIRVHQRQFIAKGLHVTLNDRSLSATNLEMLVGQVTPAVIEYEETAPDQAPVRIRIVAGVGESSPNLAGWYIICNGRVVLAADRSPVTGWGSVAEQLPEIPKYHNQYARFRGLVYFDCEDAKRLPWNTTKDGVDADAPIWRAALERMIVAARSVFDFLNRVDEEVRSQGREGPLQRALAASQRQQAEQIVTRSAFVPPDPTRFAGPVTVKIQYSRPVEQVEKLMEAFGVNTAKAVGEMSFDAALREQGE